MINQRDLIDKFLHLRRIGVVGVSHEEKDFTRSLWREFRKRGFDAIPVHPLQKEIEGVQCYSRLQDITPKVDGVLILAPKHRIAGVVDDCIAAGIHTVWIYGIRGKKDVQPDTLQRCAENGIDVVAGFCPFMFFSDTQLFHRMHAFAWKVVGLYPR